MDGFAVRCPLCSRVLQDDHGYAAHLADQHGLTDDDGTETTIEQAVVTSHGSAAVPTEQEPEPATSVPTGPRGMVVDLASVSADRIFDPDHDDARWRVLVIGLAGIVLLALVIVSGVLAD